MILVVLGIALAGILVKLRAELAIQSDAREARRYVAQGQFEEASQYLERWLNARPGSAEAWFLTARVLFAANAVESGFQALERARAGRYPGPEIERQKAIVLSHLGKHNQAEPVLRRLLLSTSQPDPEADEALAKCYFETFQLGQAETVIDRWIRNAPGVVKPHFWKLVSLAISNAQIRGPLLCWKLNPLPARSLAYAWPKTATDRYRFRRSTNPSTDC